MKLRGFRIEPGEIEAALGQHQSVKENVVVVREDVPGDKRLVAYVVPGREPAPTSSELRHFLQAKLPDYMLPSAFVVLVAIPLTPIGKIDRRALPAPDQARPELERVFVAPRTAVEETLAGIWANVLNIERVGVLDDFFELGGHSLLATQVISRVRQAFQVELPLRGLFEEPTVAGLAGRIEATRQTQSELVAPPIAPATGAGDVPLSFAQQRLWFLAQLEPESPAYNIPIAVRLAGRLDAPALEQSLNAIAKRHAVLRTTFALADGLPVQVIASTVRLALPVIDLGELSKPDRDAWAQRLVMEDMQRPFDLQSGPLLRAALIKLDEAASVLLVTLHHIVTDGWSLSIFIRELAAFYQSFTTRAPSVPGVLRLPELPIQYADFAVWQRQWLAGAVLDAQLAYWRQQLSGNLPVLALPTDRPRPPVKTYRGARQAFTFPQPLAEALHASSRREGVTLFMLLLAAFQALLSRYTGQDDVIVGSPIANRNRVEVEGLIGFFANTLALRVDLSGDPTFRELLSRVREVTLGAYAHQDLPFEKLVEELQPQRDMSRDPLFQVMFVLQNVQNASDDSFDLPDLRLSALAVDGDTAKFDLTLFVFETAQGLSGALEYNTDLFDAETAARWLGHFQTLLAEGVARPAQRLSSVGLLTEAERAQLLAWNDTAVTYPPAQRLQELVERQAANTPDAVAVVVEHDQHLSYAVLDRRANQLAHHLQGLGVGPDVPVGVCLSRSLDIAAGVLGVLKAGGVYVPLDPGYPQERLAFMLAETGARVLLVHRPLLDQLPATAGHVVCLDADWPQLEALPGFAPACATTPEHLLYILYTSGSTGKPKGVAMRHRPLINLMHWQAQTTRLNEPARTLQFASLNFDVSCQEMFFTWSTGGTLVLISEDTRRDTVQLLRVLNEVCVERVFLPFVALQHLAQVAVEQTADTPGRLREIVTAGEQLQVTPQIQHFLERLPGCVLHNQYGPTEGHVVAALTLAGDPKTWPSLPPIGRPIANVTLFVVDAHGQTTPVGVPGELLIGPAALARGYFDRPDLTAERFIPDPFAPASMTGGDVEGARLYRTGDLARYLPDGRIEFLGRIDHQVKVRGFRIELGEVEAALRQHPAVREAAVVAREDQPGVKRLVGYFVPESVAPDTIELRRFLHERLPEYMLSAALVALDALPLTPNGKVDRRSLPAPEQTGPEFIKTLVEPRDALELQLVHIWEDLLGVRPIGIRHNFFELGGHSLLAVRLMAHVEQAFGSRLPLATLFENATVEQLAVVLRDRAPAAASTSPLVKLQAGQADRQPLFFIHPAGGNVLCYTHLTRHLDRDQPFYALQAPGLNGDRELYSDVASIARHHVEVIRGVQPEGPYRLGGWSLGGIVAFEMAQQLQAAGQPVELLVLLDSHAPDGDLTFQVDDAGLLAALARDLGLASLPPLAELNSDGPPDLDARMAQLLAQAKHAGVVPASVDLTQVRRLFHVYRNNLLAARRYAPRAYAGPVTLFKASEQPGEPEETLGWGKLVGELTLHLIPGDHESIVYEPNVAVLAEKLNEQLRMVETPSAVPI